MKVFISWSGQRSAAVAEALRYWLPKVIQALEPWMSADDIEKGTRALSKQQQSTYLCTFLLGLEPTDVREPLAQFQGTRAQQDDVRKLIFTINKCLGDARLPESELSETFDVWWPRLEGAFVRRLISKQPVNPYVHNASCWKKS